MTRVMLAATIDPIKKPDIFSKLRFPLAGSPKLDGIRATADGGLLLSRDGIPIPSLQAQEQFKHLTGLDGELIYDNPTIPNVYNITQSYVMSKAKFAFSSEGESLLRFYVFDRIPLDGPNHGFATRYDSLPKEDSCIKIVPQTIIHNIEAMLEFEQQCLDANYEGIMLRSIWGQYKFNRSTFNEHLLMKLKRFVEFEAILVDILPAMKNNNELQVSNIGYAKRSQAKSGLVAMDMAGSLVVSHNDKEYNVSCGCLSHAERKELLAYPHLYLGRLAVIRHFGQNLHGYNPRHTRFVGWRDDGRKV